MIPRPMAAGLARPIPRLRADEIWRAEWELATFRADVIAGLSRAQKAIAPKYFYDVTGAALFERICDLPEYYLTRAELDILAGRADEMAALLGPDVTLVELGSGNSLKTRLLLDRLRQPRAYVPVDICAEALAAAAARLHRAHPGLLVLPVRADFTQTFALPPAAAKARRIAVFFPGSTIGNLEPGEAVLLLRKIRRRLAPGGWLIVGVDTRKPVHLLERAYNDASGVTAAFNRNLLVRIRDELGGELDPDAFEHHAFYNAPAGRIEMHLRSRADQPLRLDGHSFRFLAGETLHTESSYKYAPAEFAQLAARAGFAPAHLWQADGGAFSVHGLEARTG
ncbi:MAG TPA: L-histidine N(alpha)-methyltransferase [Planctomycetota bacterium]